jgi:hypothetical protein
MQKHPVTWGKLADCGTLFKGFDRHGSNLTDNFYRLIQYFKSPPEKMEWLPHFALGITLSRKQAGGLCNGRQK